MDLAGFVERFNGLTRRQRQVARLFCRGGYPLVCGRLLIERETAKNHMTVVYKALGEPEMAKGASKAGILCYQLGIESVKRCRHR